MCTPLAGKHHYLTTITPSLFFPNTFFSLFSSTLLYPIVYKSYVYWD